MTAPVITDNSNNPLVVVDGQSLTAWNAITVAEPNVPLDATETVSVSLSEPYSYYFGGPNPGLGTISDPNKGGSFDASNNTFTESGLIAGDPTFATNLLGSLQYNAPTIPNGYGEEVLAT